MLNFITEFFTLLILAALLERTAIHKKFFSFKPLIIILGIVIIKLVAFTPFKEISTDSYQKLYQSVMSDDSKQVKLKMAQEAVADNKITNYEYGNIMASYNSNATNSPVPDNFKVSGQHQVIPIQTDDMFNWASILHKINEYLLLFFAVTATISLLSIIAKKPILQYLSDRPVVFTPHLKTLALLSTLLVLNSAALYFVPVSESSIHKVKQFVERNSEIKEIQDLYQATNHGQKIHLIDLYKFKNVHNAVLVRQIKESFK
ncbi:hypothetical protein [Acinetobacter radioresistens]|uniref:hypothetical protein n=1 Tax=Acinetobacter radioresistens TaxID=40216 RepID=UPI00028DDEBF|nr:hypothetical protein [Acinetobacter radioresistens]BBL22384.1 hypothetical protein ACRAD_30550 [Acinetobacter radioresistens DSM 6976 = NBRC 102413 = CIP 103788]